MSSVYIYGIIPAENAVIFDAVGMDEDNEAYSIVRHDLAAVVSASPLDDYRGMERAAVVRYLVIHQQVIEAVMEEYSILPFKFGTVLPDETWVQRLLQKGDALFHETLEKVTGRVQMEVVVMWDLTAVFQEIGQEESVVQLKAQLAGRPPEETMTERVTMGQLVHGLLERRRSALEHRLLPLLKEVAFDSVVNPPMNDSMVINLALLVDEAGRQALDQRLEQLDKEFEGHLTFRRVGPLPPYSFATVQVRIPSFQEVDQARRLLELAEVVDPDNIKQAYRRMASQLHPDHNLDDPAAEDRMAKLTKAYLLLRAYTNSMPESGYPLVVDRQTVEQALLIAINRQSED